MNTLSFDKINLYSIKFDDLLYDENKELYYSTLSYGHNELKKMNVITSLLKLNKINTNFLEVEFLPSSHTFYRFMYDLDNHLISLFTDNSEQLIGNDISKEKMKHIYESTIRIPKKIPRLPRLIIRIGPKCIALNTKDEEVDILNLCKNSQVTLVLHFDKVEFHSYKTCLIYTVALIKVENDDVNNVNNTSSVKSSSKSSKSSKSFDDSEITSSDNIDGSESDESVKIGPDSDYSNSAIDSMLHNILDEEEETTSESEE